jgi:disulfide oxidoreductase YuzD
MVTMTTEHDYSINWLTEPEDHDYPAAESYLSLLYDISKVKKFVAALRAAPMSQFKSKDIFRASQLPVLGSANFHVENDLKKINNGKKLSPLLLVRDEDHGKLVIADGYHRLCAVYSTDEDAGIPCKIV